VATRQRADSKRKKTKKKKSQLPAKKGSRGRPRKESTAENPRPTGAPISLGWVLALKRLREGHTVEQLAEILNYTPGRFGNEREANGENRRIAFTPKLVNLCELSQSTVTWHTTRYAAWSGVPVGGINLIQQISSHFRDEDGSGEQTAIAVAMAKAMRDICHYVVENADELNAASLDDVPAARREAVKAHTEREPDPSKHQKIKKLLAVADMLLELYPEEARALLRADAARRFPVTKRPDQT
jgi:hypothetical protein